MAEFAPDLDDGELYLPSTILPDLGMSLPRRLTDLDRSISALALLHHHHHHLCCSPASPSLFSHPPIPDAPFLKEWDGVPPKQSFPRFLGGAATPFPSLPQVRGYGRAQAVQKQMGHGVRGVVQPNAMLRSSGRESTGTGFFLPRIGSKEALKHKNGGTRSRRGQQQQHGQVGSTSHGH